MPCVNWSEKIVKGIREIGFGEMVHETCSIENECLNKCLKPTITNECARLVWIGYEYKLTSYDIYAVNNLFKDWKSPWLIRSEDLFC